MLIQANVPAPIMTHGPVTAGPDFGRHASARLDIVGQVCCYLPCVRVEPELISPF